MEGRQCGNERCDELIPEERKKSALYCSDRCADRAAQRRYAERYPEKIRAQRDRRVMRLQSQGPLRPRTPLGAILRGNLSFERVVVKRRYPGDPSSYKPKYSGIYGCVECGLSFFTDSGQGFRESEFGVRCDKCRRRFGDAAQHRKHVGNQCQRCGYLPEHDSELEVDHIDGNRKNHHPANLQTLCACCHKIKHAAPHVFAGQSPNAPVGFNSTHKVPAVVTGKWGFQRSSTSGELVAA